MKGRESLLTDKPSFEKIDVLICVLLAAATVLVYGQIANHTFINFDDDAYIVGNPNIRDALNLKGLVWAFTTMHVANWHPLTWLSLMLDYRMFGLEAGGYLLTNLIFHGINSLLVFAVFNAMTAARWQSAFVAALFALHPLHVESVAWVSERKDVLSAFFWLLTLGAYARYVKKPQMSRYIVALGCFLCGLMAKPMLVTLPFVLLLLDFWPLRRLETTLPGADGPASFRRRVSSLVVEKVPFFILAVLSGAITVLAQKEGGALIDTQLVGMGERLSNALISYTAYILKMAWPYDLAIFYPHPQTVLMGQAAVSLMVLIVVTSWVVTQGRKAPFLAVGWFWYLGTLAPVIGIVQVGSQAMADRYTYMPLVGLFVMIAWGTPQLLERGGSRHKKTILALAAGIVLLNLAVTSWAQVKYWRNSLSLFQHALDVTKDNYVAHNQLGKMYSLLGKNEEAERHFREALRMKPYFYPVHQNWGNHLAFNGRFEEAVYHYREALKATEDPVLHNSLAHALASVGEADEAIVHYREALRLKTDFYTAQVNLADLLASLDRLDEAAAHYREALRLKPDDAYAERGLMNLKNRSGR